jgi:hypothetical protein
MSTSLTTDVSATTWSQAKGTARTFRAHKAGVLRVTFGRAWATLSNSAHTAGWSPQPRWCPELDPGDLFLGPNSALTLRAGQSVVIESWPADRDSGTGFVWEPLAASAGAQRWHVAVVQPTRELGQGLLLVLRALGRLARGLAAYSEYLVAGRGKVQSCLESNAP